MKTIDMQQIRYLNLFVKITNVKTSHCFTYNNFVIFCVPKNMISRAIWENGKNVKQVSYMIGKRVKIIPNPEGIINLRKFIEAIVNPATFRELEIKGNEIILIAGSQNKAILIGRNKRRLIELQKIVKDYFGKELRIK